MERLSCTSTVSYNATEAAIHMARYQLAAPYCNGKRVLDVACGEGYGAYTLRQLGATSVDGVDASQQAIANAETLFAKRGVRFHLHEAETVDELFANKRFDVIVCLETIEHLRDPQRFLRAIKTLAANDAVIIVTCPNDHWYYASDQSNPFHVRKYTFEAFRELTTGVLGHASTWGYGAPVIGFGTVADEFVAGKEPLLGQAAMLDFRTQASSIVLPPRGFSNIGPRNCTYFVGIWGGDTARVHTSAVVPISMDDYSNLVSWETARLSPARIGELEGERSALLSEKLRLEQRIAQAQSERAELQGRCETLREEQEVAGNHLEQARKEHEGKLDAVFMERDRYRIQAFALAKEMDLVGIQLGKVSAARDRYSVERDAALAERSGYLVERDAAIAERRESIDRNLIELENARELAKSLMAEQEQLQARLRAQEGLRYLTKATAKALVRRAAFKLRPFIVRPARLVKPYLPAPALSLVRRIALALRL